MQTDVATMEGIFDAGTWLVARWNKALAEYRVERDRFLAWYSKDADLKKLSPAMQARADNLWTQMQRFEVAIDKIGRVLTGAGETWEGIKATVMQAIPSRAAVASWFGLSGIAPPASLGAAQIVIGAAGVAILTAAVLAAGYLARGANAINYAQNVYADMLRSQTGGTRAPTADEVSRAVAAANAAAQSKDVPELFGLPWYYPAGGLLALWLLFGRRGGA